MTSEIRANIIKNRVGLGTIEYSNTGPVISGVTTASNFKTGTSNLHSTGLNIFDLDVDGHTNLDNVSISGISSTGNIYITTGGNGRKLSFAGDGSSHYIKMDDTLNGPIINGYGGIAFETNGTNERLRINSSGEIISYNGTLKRNVSDSSFTVSGDTASNTGANINLYGASHGSLANVFRVRTGSTERLRITSDGKMGLGINNPTGQFAVSDGTRIAEINPHSSGTFIGNRSNHDVLFQINAATKAKIDTNGHLTITDGDLVIGTSGHGISFAATADYGTSTPAELLDDYEEGQFLPSYSPASGSITMLTRRGEYCKVGRVVHCMFSCSANGSSSPSGTVTITGLPFTGEVPSANGPRGGGGVVFAGYHAPTSLSHCNVNGNTLYLFLNDHSYLQANTSGTGFGYNAYQISGFFSYLTTA